MPPENFELLRALKCVLGASEAPFMCMHTVHTYLQVAIFVQLQIKKYFLFCSYAALRQLFYLHSQNPWVEAIGW